MLSARMILVFVVALGATSSVLGRTHHRAPKKAAPTVATTPVEIRKEEKRDPADIALDRKIKGICRGC
jgi:hypothetical protein